MWTEMAFPKFWNRGPMVDHGKANGASIPDLAPTMVRPFATSQELRGEGRHQSGLLRMSQNVGVFNFDPNAYMHIMHM